MTTKETVTSTKRDVIAGLEFLCEQAERIAANFTDADWAGPGDHGGWKARQVYSHVAGIGALIPQFVDAYVNAGPENDLGPNTNMEIINGGLVAERVDRSPRELGDEFAKNYAAVIAWVKEQPEAYFQRRGTLGGYVNWTAADLIVTAFVMHAIAHLYNASARFP